MTSYVIISVCTAVALFLLYRGVSLYFSWRDRAEKRAEAKDLRDEIDKALSGPNPDLRRAAALRHRLRELGELTD